MEKLVARWWWWLVRLESILQKQLLFPVQIWTVQIQFKCWFVILESLMALIGSGMLSGEERQWRKRIKTELFAYRPCKKYPLFKSRRSLDTILSNERINIVATQEMCLYCNMKVAWWAAVVIFSATCRNGGVISRWGFEPCYKVVKQVWYRHLANRFVVM